MTIFKEKIANNFSKAANSYEQAAEVQKICSKLLINKIHELEPDLEPKSILDLGTGTGFTAEILYQTYPEANFTLNDISPTMLCKAKDKFKKYDNFEFILGDMENTYFNKHDLIVSNLSMQWLNNIDSAIENIYNKTKLLAFSCLLDDSFDYWYSVLQNIYPQFKILNFPKQYHLNKMLENLQPARLVTSAQKFKLLFPDAKSTMIYLKNLGAQTSINSIATNVVKDLIQNYSKEIELEYHVFFAVLKR